MIAGDLTPECAAVVTAVLESLSAPLGAEDTRSREQRYHDALQEAMRWFGSCIVISVTSCAELVVVADVSRSLTRDGGPR